MTYISRLTACLVGLAATALLCLSNTVVASEGEDWYQVEVIIFTREGQMGNIEQWPRNIALRYPLNWVALEDPEAREAAYREATEQDLPSWERGLAAQPQPVDYLREAFYPLPSDERNMDRYAGALNRSGDYRVLFHEAWRQPVLNRDQAPALLIQGGDMFGEHRELEGSITLSLSRYLHLHTRLWLTDFEPNYGQPPGAWPELPRRPDHNQSGLTHSRLTSTADSPSDPSADNWSALQWEEDWQDRGNSGGGHPAWDLNLDTTSGLPDFMEDDYLPRRIATMTQQRRMRSDELHYIDHPLLGLLVRIRSYTYPADET